MYGGVETGSEQTLRAEDLLATSDPVRLGDDLVFLAGARELAHIPNYFATERRSFDDLDLGDGLSLSAAMIEDLAESFSIIGQPGEMVAVLDHAFGTVTLKRPGQPRRTAQAREELLAGDLLEIASLSRASVHLSDTTRIELGGRARVRVDNRVLLPGPDGRQRLASVELTLLTGAFFARTAPTGPQPPVVSLRTPLGTFAWSDATLGGQILMSGAPDLLAVLGRADGATGIITLIGTQGPQAITECPAVVALERTGRARVIQALLTVGELEATLFSRLMPSRGLNQFNSD
jgi:hypothetical protein